MNWLALSTFDLRAKTGIHVFEVAWINVGIGRQFGHTSAVVTKSVLRSLTVVACFRMFQTVIKTMHLCCVASSCEHLLYVHVMSMLIQNSIVQTCVYQTWMQAMSIGLLLDQARQSLSITCLAFQKKD